VRCVFDIPVMCVEVPLMIGVCSELEVPVVGNQKRFPDESCESEFFLQKIQHMQQFKTPMCRANSPEISTDFQDFWRSKEVAETPV